MTFDWATLALQTINFLILVWLLRRFLYRPVLAVIDRRRAETQAAQAQAQAAERTAKAAEQDWRQRGQELEIDAARRRTEAEAELGRRGEAVMAEARAQADRILAEARDLVASERRAAAADLKTQAAGVATVLATRLLEVVAPGVGTAPFLAVLTGRLAAMTPAERALLGKGMVRIEVAPPLSPPQREEWKRRLAETVGDVTFADCPELIAGARLVTPAAALEVSWADALVQARKDMVDNGQSD